MSLSKIARYVSAVLPAAVFGIAAAGGATPDRPRTVQTIFVIVLENHNWTQPARADAVIHALKDNPDAPWCNNELKAMSSYADAYHNVRVGMHPSEPNYIWMEAGDNLGIKDDNDPALNHRNHPNHLTAYLRAAHIPWRTYQEDIDGDRVPLEAIVPSHPAPWSPVDRHYKPKHNPFVFFDDNIGVDASHPMGNAQDPYGIAHNRPLSELRRDLDGSNVARYNFIMPNMFHDMHDSYRGKPSKDSDNSVKLDLDRDKFRQGDAWLKQVVPMIMNSAAYKHDGAIFILWEETEGPTKTDRDTDEFTLPLFVVSPLAKGGGYHNSVAYDHGSLLRTLQEIFHVGPWLGDAGNVNDLSDLFLPGAIPQGAPPQAGAGH